jgi:hypothetical protein
VLAADAGLPEQRADVVAGVAHRRREVERAHHLHQAIALGLDREDRLHVERRVVAGPVEDVRHQHRVAPRRDALGHRVHRGAHAAGVGVQDHAGPRALRVGVVEPARCHAVVGGHVELLRVGHARIVSSYAP